MKLFHGINFLLIMGILLIISVYIGVSKGSQCSFNSFRFMKCLHKPFCSICFHMLLAITIISTSDERVAISCFKPYFSILISVSDNVLPVKLLINLFGIFCSPYVFSTIKLPSFLFYRSFTFVVCLLI